MTGQTVLARLFVDDRWSGAHGIGRYASEVLSRLSVPWRSLALPGRPSGPMELLRSVPVERDDALYSPGYNTFLGVRQQFVTIHDLIHLRVSGVEGLKYKAYYTAARALVRRSGLVFTVSEASANDIRGWLRDDDVEIVNTRGGCSPAFVPDGEAADEGAPYFLFVGNLRAHKNIRTFLNALREVEARGVVVLPQSERPELFRLLDEMGVSNRVRVVSSISDEELATLYRGAVALVFPSTLEGFGLPALESIRSGTPVVYWRGCDSVSEIVGPAGISVAESQDADEWAGAMQRAAHEDRRIPPGAAEQFSWDRTASSINRALSARLGASERDGQR
ncbi:glycosyltransferase family 1 protein [Microbacterium sp. SORGH_AS_0862]|uniref:glycosyltransferase family 4 protein n=1 Tax=Microbacterium sp. SORGH_AS_0862 TaxID=3041789 RepID=UPI0027925BC4|nr:glycosyltransferase family 1 protein [Microbacterium sp. SORGH_AS_0862]MDQ1205649.1 glycosyltransferase involved in cell wall biosynthesis [Microbacterium sp. SORGH_AS_0862]